jgi:hypothetical protein
MSVDTRIGLVGLVVALFSIAAFYLWPDKKWIGWLCLSVGIVLLIGWIVFELKQKLGESWTSLGISVLVGAVFGGAIGALIWHSAQAPSRQQDVGQGSTRSPVVETSGSTDVSPPSPETPTKGTEVQPALGLQRSQTSTKKQARSRSDENLKRPSGINQTMTNSPGGIQAGRDVTINRERPSPSASPASTKDRKQP